MNERKSFFRERTKKEILDLNTRRIVYTPKGLVDRIDCLHNDEALFIHTNLVPGRFSRNVKTMAEASRKFSKHGDLILLSHPTSKEKCSSSLEVPVEIRRRDFEKLRDMREENINFVGFSFQPNWDDRKKRVVDFVSCPEALKLFSYSEHYSPISVEPYSDSRRVRQEGASVVLEVPSRTRKKSRYKFRLEHIPVEEYSPDLLSTALTIRPQVVYEEGELKKGRTEHDIYNLRYTYESERERSNVINLLHLDIAGYIAIMKHYALIKNTAPMEMNPFVIPSRHQARFYSLLTNNILIMDPSIEAKRPEQKYRKLHLAERSILLGRAIGRFGHDDFCFWDRERDGKLKDYSWSTS
jgi:hypothetical protein